LTSVTVDEGVKIPFRAKLHDDVLRKGCFDVVLKADDVDVIKLSKELDFHGDCIGEGYVHPGRDLHSLDSKELRKDSRRHHKY
jgi:hypothetical protein